MDINSQYGNLLKPSQALLEDVAKLKGDILILGAGGKMGPALARLTREAIVQSRSRKKVIAVTRFSSDRLEAQLQSEGIETVRADLLEDNQLSSLPAVENVLYIAGTKFGTSGNESLTWAMNSYLPGRVAEKFKQSRIVAFSTGNVYPFSDTAGRGPSENDPVSPIGEYAQSCLGRERVFQYFSEKNNTPTLIYRLNYANDVSYGVLVDIARAVSEGKTIDLRMGHVNLIWQKDANEIALRCLHHCSVPAKILNVTGTEVLSVRKIAAQFGEILKKTPKFVNEEQPAALLSNAGEAARLFGKPKTSLEEMVQLIAGWISSGGKTLNKPTHFQEREGKF